MALDVHGESFILILGKMDVRTYGILRRAIHEIDPNIKSSEDLISAIADREVTAAKLLEQKQVGPKAVAAFKASIESYLRIA